MLTDSAFYVAFHCYTIIVGVTQPTVKSSSFSPSGILSSSTFQGKTKWSIEFDQEITKAETSAYINFYFSNGTLYFKLDSLDSVNVFIENYTLSFYTNEPFHSGSYYILFDYGVVRGTLFCKPSSNPITDTLFWTFTIPQTTTTTTTTTTSTIALTTTGTITSSSSRSTSLKPCDKPYIFRF